MTTSTPSTPDILESVDQGIGTLTLNRPDSRNALSREIMVVMDSTLKRWALDPQVRAVVITGTGRAFCSGGDVKAFSKLVAGGQPMSFDQRVHDLRARMDFTRLLHEMPKPTLAVIPGPAAGAGFSLALACDMRITADDAKLTTAFSKIGLSGDFGGSYFLTHLVGSAMARELYFTGRVFTGKEALGMGIVNRSVPYEQLEQAARQYAQELAALPTVAVGYMKRNLNLALKGSLSENLDAEAIHMIRTFETDDHKSAVVAFVEKRPSTFHGR